MEIINLEYPLQLDFEPQESVMAMGFFDGVHKGHQRVIKTAKKIADEKGLPLTVFTYDHHPAVVYKKLDANQKRYLSPLSRKMDLMEDLGVDKVYIVNYNSAFQNQKPQTFVDNYLIRLKANTVVAGFDHTYGAKKASMKDLPGYAQNRFDVVTVDCKDADGKKISSTRIRKYFSEGNIQKANELLGYVFENEGTVIHGYARGRELGFPTANIEYSDKQRLPELGVYIVEIKVNGIWYSAMASMGLNETFGDHNPVTLEINILDFNEDIYGNKVQVRWLKKMRDNVKFNGRESLIDQLKIDEQATRDYFKNIRNK